MKNKLLNNTNFRNNQNYILGDYEKKKMLLMYFTKQTIIFFLKYVNKINNISNNEVKSLNFLKIIFYPLFIISENRKNSSLLSFTYSLIIFIPMMISLDQRYSFIESFLFSFLSIWLYTYIVFNIYKMETFKKTKQIIPNIKSFREYIYSNFNNITQKTFLYKFFTAFCLFFFLSIFFELWEDSIFYFIFFIFSFSIVFIFNIINILLLPFLFLINFIFLIFNSFNVFIFKGVKWFTFLKPNFEKTFFVTFKMNKEIIVNTTLYVYVKD